MRTKMLISDQAIFKNSLKCFLNFFPIGIALKGIFGIMMATRKIKSRSKSSARDHICHPNINGWILVNENFDPKIFIAQLFQICPTVGGVNFIYFDYYKKL